MSDHLDMALDLYDDVKRLEAANVELLAALKMAVEWAETSVRSDDPMWSADLDRITDIIVKHEGSGQ